MKEIRPFTWIILGVMTLLIFIPAFFIDTATITYAPAPGVNDNTTPTDGPQGPQVPNKQPAGNTPDEDGTPSEAPEDDGEPDNDAVE